ncbi:hypothetical protein FHT78_005850 [Rhizobium sp. BK196]|nr:hypothetical protein [Rhizobium sp. BK196]
MFETGRRLDAGHLAKVTAGDTFGYGDRIGVPTSLQGIESRATVKRPMWRDQKAVDRPGSCQDFMQFRERGIRATVLIELPHRETITTFGTIQAKHLSALSLRVDRDPRNAQEIRKRVCAQHIILAQDLRYATATSFSCNCQSGGEFFVRFGSLFHRERVFSFRWVFLDNRNCLRSGEWINNNAEANLVTSLLAEFDGPGILPEERFLEVGLSG